MDKRENLNLYKSMDTKLRKELILLNFNHSSICNYAYYEFNITENNMLYALKRWAVQW